MSTLIVELGGFLTKLKKKMFLFLVMGNSIKRIALQRMRFPLPDKFFIWRVDCNSEFFDKKINNYYQKISLHVESFNPNRR